MSADRILTTHVGSLPRPQDVVDCLFAQDRGESYDAAHFDATMRRAVTDVVRRQHEVGLDVINDGEMSKISYATYIRHRLNGFEIGTVPRATPQDLDDYPEYRDKIAAAGATPKYFRPICKGPISVKTLAPLNEDLARLKEALETVGTSRGFMTAVSPGTIAVFQPNEYYASHAAYLEALAVAMRPEYEAIVAARLHICWGNYEGPHTRDIPLSKVLPALLKAKPAQLLIEGANPRHEHEWALWETHRLPEDKILVPGVLDTSCNFVEHPELVAQRLVRYARLVGRERVIAGTDCGFGTFAGFGAVHPAICWVKMQSLVEGARLASEALWGRAAA